MNKSIIGIVVGLMIAISAVYFVETSEELFEEQDMVKGPFFLIVAIAYLPVAYLMLTKKSALPHVVAIVGTVGIIALYAVTRTDMAIVFGMEAGSIGHLGMVSKILQVGVVLGSILTLVQVRKESQNKPKLEEVKQ
jgi:hypothetical protein